MGPILKKTFQKEPHLSSISIFRPHQQPKLKLNSKSLVFEHLIYISQTLKANNILPILFCYHQSVKNVFRQSQQVTDSKTFELQVVSHPASSLTISWTQTVLSFPPRKQFTRLWLNVMVPRKGKKLSFICFPSTHLIIISASFVPSRRSYVSIT